MGVARVLLLADTHLGFDLPFRPRVERRRRGPDFFANFERALEPARRGAVDCVIHGGDILYRSKVPAELVHMAFEPLKTVARLGTPVVVVPGNHERSGIPYGLLASHPGIFLFDRPRTHVLRFGNSSIALAGFPFVRRHIRGRFPAHLDQTGWRESEADVTILCMHQVVEGAVVGPADYVFRRGDNVVKALDIPEGFAAVASGHIHRYQVLTKDLSGRPLAAPVFYPGSIERTTFAEKDEKKGYMILEIDTGASGRGSLRHWRFHELPTRPMYQLELKAQGMKAEAANAWAAAALEELPGDAVVKIRIHGELRPVLGTAHLRSLAPPTMNVSVKWV